MNEREHDFSDDEVQITDLDPLDSPQYRRATLIMRVVQGGLRRRWIRYGLTATLLLLLLGALVMQWPRPVPPANPAPTSNRAFLSATSGQGLLFVQGSNFALTAYSLKDWRARWQVSLPAAANLQAQELSLFCTFAIPNHKTVLEALNSLTGQVRWRDVLPTMAFTNVFGYTHALYSDTEQISRGQLTPSVSYDNGTFYAQDSQNTIYAIQASTGHISWTHRANDQANGPTYSNLSMPLYVKDGIVEFLSTEAIVHILDASTGREILSLTHLSSLWPVLTVDGQMLYNLPPPSGPAIHAFRMPYGQQAWTYPLSHGTWVQAESDGVIYLGADTGAKLIALSGSDGHQLWSYQASDLQPVNGTFFAENGICYILQRDATLLSIRVSDGHVLWRSQIKDFAESTDSTTFITMDQGLLTLRDQNADASLPLDVVDASDGHLLWRSNEPLTSPQPVAGVLYNIASNGRVEAWREIDGRPLWRFEAPVGSNFVWTLRNVSALLFIQDPTSNLYALRSSDGKLLWRYPS